MTSDELQDAELHIIKSVQQKTFKDEYDALKSKKPLHIKSKLISLKRVFKADTRLQHAKYLHMIQDTLSYFQGKTGW